MLAVHFDRFYQNPKDAFSIFRGLLQLPGIVRIAGPDHIEVLLQRPDSPRWLKHSAVSSPISITRNLAY